MNRRIPGLDPARRAATPAPKRADTPEVVSTMQLKEPIPAPGWQVPQGVRTQQGTVTLKPPQPPRALTGRTIELNAAIRADTMSTIRRDEDLVLEFVKEAEASDRHRIRLPEKIFRDNFLPFVNGEAYEKMPEGWTEEQARKYASDKWTQVAHGAANEVDVFDDSGEVVFTMPAFSDMSQLNIKQPMNRPPLRHYTRLHDENSRTSGAIAKAHMDRGIQAKMYDLFDGVKDSKDYEAKLEKMRQYYGIEKSAEEKAAGPGGGGSTLDQLGEMLFD